LVALRPLLDGCAALLAPEIARKALSFHLDLDPSLPDAAELDPTRLRQLLLNLLSNAVKFTPTGGRVDMRVNRIGDDRLRIEVQDNGPGVPADKRHLLFEDFVQLAPQGTADGQGTGLGLAISARLVALMQGEIGCDEASGGGALFWFEVPLRSAALPGPEVATPGDAIAQQADAVPLRILVVDDVPANRQIAQAMLTSAGHVVEAAEDGVSALHALSSGSFDVVLMDLQMPGMDGFEATRRIRALPHPACAVPVVALTASALPDQIEATRRAGMDAHLAKPIDRQALLQLLRELPMRSAGQAGVPVEAAPAAPYIDVTTLDLLERELGHAAHGILAEFVGEVRRALSLLTNATPAEKAEAGHVQHAAHRLVGAARTLGASRLAEEAEALQRAARGGDPSPDLQASVIAVARATLPELERRLGVEGVLAGFPAQALPAA
ncbi:MAG TPA: ATP-binding protein, partial [Roseomonas sp.]|nr:ATP-binding protein [Roseomonas sp.]